MTQSPSGSTIPILDSAGIGWTIVSAQVAQNGIVDASTANVVLLLYWIGSVYHMNSSGGWWKWANSAWVGSNDPRVTESPESTIVIANSSGNGGTIHDAKLNAWTLAAGVVKMNGTTAGFSANVVELYYHNHVVYQENSSQGWWYWDGAGWSGTTSPVPLGAVALTGLTLSASSFSASAAAGTVVGNINVQASGGTFSGALALSGANASSFKLAGNVVTTASALPSGSYSITITANMTGATGSPLSRSFILTSAAGASVNINLAAPTGAILYKTLFGSSMASDVDFTGGNGSGGWSNTASQTAAKTTAGFGLSGMYARSNTNETSFNNGAQNTTYTDRVSHYLPNIIAMPSSANSVNATTGLFSYSLGGGTTDPATFAAAAKATAQRFITNGTPVYAYEILNESDGRVDDNTYCAIFNATADALHSVDASYLVIGMNYAWMNAGSYKTFAQQCGSKIGMLCYHSYSVDPSVSTSQCMQTAISRFSNDAAGLRAAVAGTAAAHTPACVGEYNMDGNPPGDSRQLTEVGAVFNLLALYSAFMADPLTQYGAIWDWLGDGYYGLVIDPQNNPGGLPANSVIPVGYALKNCRNYLGGNVVSSTVPSGMNLKCLATTSGTKFGVLLINYDTSSSYTVNVAGLGAASSLTYTEVSHAHQAGMTQTISQASLGNLVIPAMSVVTLSN